MLMTAKLITYDYNLKNETTSYCLDPYDFTITVNKYKYLQKIRVSVVPTSRKAEIYCRVLGLFSVINFQEPEV